VLLLSHNLLADSRDLKCVLLSEGNEASNLDLAKPNTYVTTLLSYVGYENVNYKEKVPWHILRKSQSNKFLFNMEFIATRTTKVKVTFLILGKDSTKIEFGWNKVKAGDYWKYTIYENFPYSWKNGCYEMIVYISTKPLSDGGTIVSTCRFQIKN